MEEKVLSRRSLQLQLLPVLAILLISILAGCAAKKNMLEDPKTGQIFQYQMPENQVLKYQISEETTQNMEVMGQSIKIEMNKTCAFSMKSKGLEDNYQLEVTVDSMNANVVTPQGEMFPDMSNVVGKSFDMTLSVLGKELDLSGAGSIQWELSGEKHSIAPDFQAIFPDLADMPVKIGDTWTSKDAITEKNDDNELHINLEGVNTLEGFETVNGLECAKITVVVTGTLDGKGKQEGMDLVTGGKIKGTETWYFAYKKGIFVKSITEGIAESTTTVSGAQNITIPTTRKFKTEVELIK